MNTAEQILRKHAKIPEGIEIHDLATVRFKDAITAIEEILVNNPKNKTENITKEQLIEFGMKETEGDSAIIFPMAKVISIPQDDQADDELSICVTQLRNQTEICLKLPDGSTLYLCPENIEELKTFEKCIESYEPIY